MVVLAAERRLGSLLAEHAVLLGRQLLLPLLLGFRNLWHELSLARGHIGADLAVVGDVDPHQVGPAPKDGRARGLALERPPLGRPARHGGVEPPLTLLARYGPAAAGGEG